MSELPEMRCRKELPSVRVRIGTVIFTGYLSGSQKSFATVTVDVPVAGAGVSVPYHFEVAWQIAASSAYDGAIVRI